MSPRGDERGSEPPSAATTGPGRRTGARATCLLTRRAAKSEPRTNRSAGPKLMAAARPTKYTPGTDDSNQRESTGPAAPRSIRPRRSGSKYGTRSTSPRCQLTHRESRHVSPPHTPSNRRHPPSPIRPKPVDPPILPTGSIRGWLLRLPGRGWAGGHLGSRRRLGLSSRTASRSLQHRRPWISRGCARGLAGARIGHAGVPTGTRVSDREGRRRPSRCTRTAARCPPSLSR